MDSCVEHFVQYLRGENFVQYLRGEKNASEHTISNYLMDIRQFVELTWGDEAKVPYRWKEADRFAARKFIVFFQKLEMAPTTTGRKLSALRSFYKFLVREEYVPDNPFVGLPLPKKGHYLPTVLSVNEVTQLLEAPHQMAAAKKPTTIFQEYAPVRDTAILEVLYSTGMRIGELVGMKESQIDILSGIVSVLGKGKKERLCPLGRPAEIALQNALSMRSEVWTALGKKANPKNVVFLNKHGGAITARSVERMMNFATALRPICSIAVPTCAACRSY